MAAFHAAWAAGADGIELDVRMTRDGELVVFHDEDGARLANDPRSVRDCLWTDIRKWQVRGEPVPLLADVLAAAPAGSTVLIELKAGREILAPLRRLLAASSAVNTCILTFRPAVAWAARDLGRPVWLNLEARHLWLVRWGAGCIAWAGITGMSMAWCEAINQELMRILAKRNMVIACWTINDPFAARRARDLGVGTLMTDDPANIIRSLV